MLSSYLRAFDVRITMTGFHAITTIAIIIIILFTTKLDNNDSKMQCKYMIKTTAVLKVPMGIVSRRLLNIFNSS